MPEEMRHLLRIGIAPGTFDPMTAAQAEALYAAGAELRLDRMLLLPWMSEGKAFAAAEERLPLARYATDWKGIALDYAHGEVRCLSSAVDRLCGTETDAAHFLIMTDGQLRKARCEKAFEEIRRRVCLCCFSGESDPDLRTPENENGEVRLRTVCPADHEEAVRDALYSLRDPDQVRMPELMMIAKTGLYQPCSPQVRTLISEHRWKHTLGVRNAAVHLAAIHHAPVIKSAVAAYYHDCAKGMETKTMRRILLEKGLCSDESILASGALMHGIAGAWLAREKFGIQDEETLSAIRNHTLGRTNMSLTEKVVFVADAIEENREPYPGLEELRNLAEVSLDAAVLYSLALTKQFVRRSGKHFHLRGESTYQWLNQHISEQERTYVEERMGQHGSERNGGKSGADPV